METIPFETRRDLYKQHGKNDNVAQLRKVYSLSYGGACEKLEHYEKQLMTICPNCSPEHHKVVATLVNDYEGLALDYLEYMTELKKGTHSSFINQGE